MGRHAEWEDGHKWREDHCTTTNDIHLSWAPWGSQAICLQRLGPSPQAVLGHAWFPKRPLKAWLLRLGFLFVPGWSFLKPPTCSRPLFQWLKISVICSQIVGIENKSPKHHTNSPQTSNLCEWVSEWVNGRIAQKMLWAGIRYRRVSTV